MCVIVYKPKNIPYPSEDIISSCWDANSHGAGYMLSVNNQLIVRKGIMNKSLFMKEYNSLKHNDSVVFHFRIASHGEVNAKNTHPWKVTDKLAIVHNGIIDFCGRNNKVSDSKIFASHLSNFNLCNQSHKIILEQAIGPNNKIVALNNFGTVTILNESSGKWLNDIWYSNIYWKSRMLKNDEIDFNKDYYIFDKESKTFVIRKRKQYYGF